MKTLEEMLIDELANAYSGVHEFPGLNSIVTEMRAVENLVRRVLGDEAVLKAKDVYREKYAK